MSDREKEGATCTSERKPDTHAYTGDSTRIGSPGLINAFTAYNQKGAKKAESALRIYIVTESQKP